MKKNMMCAVGFGIMLAASSALCAEIKIAVVDMEVVMKAYPETQSSRLILEQQVGEFETEQREMVKELEEMNKVFMEARDQSRNPALSDDAREKNRVIAEGKLTDLQNRKRELEETAGLRRKQLQEQQMRMRQRIVKKLREIVKGYAEGKGIDLVLDSALPGTGAPESVVYSAPPLDITEAILGLLKAGSAAAEPKTGE